MPIQARTREQGRGCSEDTRLVQARALAIGRGSGVAFVTHPQVIYNRADIVIKMM